MLLTMWNGSWIVECFDWKMDEREECRNYEGGQEIGISYTSMIVLWLSCTRTNAIGTGC